MTMQKMTEVNDYLSSKEIAKRLHIHQRTIPALAAKHEFKVLRKGYNNNRYSLSQIQAALESGRPNQANYRFVEPSATKTYDDFWKLDWDEFIVAADCHSPYLYTPIYDKMMDVAAKYKIKKFVHAGDFWNQDTFSYWWVAKEDCVSFDQEVAYSKKIVNSLTKQFDDVRFFLGSHDIRFWKLLYSQGKFDTYDTVWNLLENNKIHVSSYRYCEVGDEWRINHPKNTVKVGGLPAIRMSAKFGRSVIFGHGHWQGWVWDPSGKHLLMAPGCLCDPKKISYKNLWDTSHDEWVPGFVLVRDRTRATVFNMDSDWDLYLGKKKK